MTQSPSSVSRNIPQWQNDIAVVMRCAVSGRKYLILPNTMSHSDKLTDKMQRQFKRVAKAVKLTLIFNVRTASLRDDKLSRGAPPIILTQDVSELAARLLEEYQQRGGRMA